MTDTPAGVIYASIERDNRHRWHPVIEIRLRGQQVTVMTGLQGYATRTQAEMAAAKEAERLEKGKPSNSAEKMVKLGEK